MEFWKINGAGNDFIVVDDRQDAIPDEKWPEIIRTVCERHMSIGADGFMVVKKPTYGGDYKMLFFNSDGSMGEMCGNGARCIAGRLCWIIRLHRPLRPERYFHRMFPLFPVRGRGA